MRAEKGPGIEKKEEVCKRSVKGFLKLPSGLVLCYIINPGKPPARLTHTPFNKFSMSISVFGHSVQCYHLLCFPNLKLCSFIVTVDLVIFDT